MKREEIEKPFIVANVREITDQLAREEITYSRMVELLNQTAIKWHISKVMSLKFPKH